MLYFYILQLNQNDSPIDTYDINVYSKIYNEVDDDTYCKMCLPEHVYMEALPEEGDEATVKLQVTQVLNVNKIDFSLNN